MSTKELQELKRKVNTLWKQDFPRMKKILDLQTAVRKLKNKEEEVTSGEISELYYLNKLVVKENKKLLKRIVWIEKALELKADKKVLKVEAKKQKNSLIFFAKVFKKLLNKKNK